MAGLFQALVLRLWRLRRENLTFRVYPKSLLDENKWRAVRYGIQGRPVDETSEGLDEEGAAA